MAIYKHSDAATALNTLLDLERQYLLSGEIGILTSLAPEKERLMRLLPTTKQDTKHLKVLVKKITRNQSMLIAAGEGIRTASRRLEALRNQKSQLRTYDAGGQSHDLSHRTTSFEKRA
ncbi:flagellar biosynthesis protein FlgN [Aliiroseovarius sp. KMU-50]|uniref:Flagellar biosynthesis protein FlgN n=1 Tax=Aliiroseovarius salicola TaxID=3009082 RepID=A0ABT4W3Q1_9RHOB|nr:flagellar biosynthesis protein FlgN [Aliiroseovarius sp. KMU-50]MDA5095105.1 flagellar biosynthesis protein FlgN [Aliiroseovarius sp. KMU-50]